MKSWAGPRHSDRSRRVNKDWRHWTEAQSFCFCITQILTWRCDWTRFQRKEENTSWLGGFIEKLKMRACECTVFAAMVELLCCVSETEHFAYLHINGVNCRLSAGWHEMGFQFLYGGLSSSKIVHRARMEMHWVVCSLRRDAGRTGWGGGTGDHSATGLFALQATAGGLVGANGAFSQAGQCRMNAPPTCVEIVANGTETSPNRKPSLQFFILVRQARKMAQERTQKPRTNKSRNWKMPFFASTEWQHCASIGKF